MAATTNSTGAAHPDELFVNIIEEIATHTNTDPIQLPPLESAVDTEAMTDLLDSDQFCEIVFSYRDLLVTVDSEGHIQVS